MKKILLVATMVAACSTAFAGEFLGNGVTAAGTAQQQQASLSAATNAGNAQSITINQAAIPANTRAEVAYSGSYDVKNVPGIIAPALTSSNDTCMGSSSLGAAGVGFGVTIGSSWTDDNCVMLKNSRELYNMGMKGAAMARMCMDAKNKEALELTGFVCPQTAKENAAKVEAEKTASN